MIIARPTLPHLFGNKYVSKEINGKRLAFSPSNRTWTRTLLTATFHPALQFPRRKATAAAQRTQSGSGWWLPIGSAQSRASSIRAQKGCSSPCWETEWERQDYFGGAMEPPWVFDPTKLTFRNGSCFPWETQVNSLMGYSNKFASSLPSRSSLKGLSHLL